MSEKRSVVKSELAQIEEQILGSWETEGTFEKSVQNREGAERFNFNDGPPFANGLPHFGHSLVTAIKDSILRYKTMRGYYVPRRNGWDCHGLPVEYTIEKEFGISGKKQILELGLDKFNAASRDSIFRYKGEWEAFLKRIGRWSDYDNYYATVDTNYTESVWWILKEIDQKGLLYRGLKSVPYCPRCETPLSNFELNEGYRDNVPDPSVFVLFPLKDDPSTQILAWTTTPWTLPANTALAVDADADYAYVELKSGSNTLVLAKERLDVLELRSQDYKVLKMVKGSELVGLRYEPLYKPDDPNFTKEQIDKAWHVFATDYATVEEGTGIVHTGTSYGEVDLDLIMKENLPRIESVDSSGHLIFGPENALGKFFKDADEQIIADLTHKNRIFAAEIAEHTYPFCWRCDTPLMYFATSTWFVAVTKVKEDMLRTAQDINWTPSHIKDGRFGQWLEGARDWAISRNRYWGAPMPIWVNMADEDDFLVIGSLEELKELSGGQINLPEIDDQPDLHRPYIDDIVIQKDGKTYKRVEEVLDCWFESGSMPFAQWHYPFENKEKLSEVHPADFITEGLDQTRLWFYVQHVISTIILGKPAYNNVVVTGIILAADGQKLSKRLRNYPPAEEVFDHEGADALRLNLLSSVQATETADYMRFYREAVTDTQRNVLLTLFNSYKFFKTYADIDKWRPKNGQRPESAHILDQWILARLDETISVTTKNADSYKIAHALEPVFHLIDDLSNWYIRRSRRRFWKSENDSDKEAAYSTLHHCLLTTSQLLAPWAPFLSDYLWRELRQGSDLADSVHLSDWPSVKQPDNTSNKLLDEMNKTRQIISDGLSQRAEAKIKVRQPLARATISSEIGLQPQLLELLREELNVKEVTSTPQQDLVKLDVAVTPELKAEGMARELIRYIQTARKEAGFNVDDRIKLRIETDSPEVTEAAHRFRDVVFAETLAEGELEQGSQAEHSKLIHVDGQEVTLSLRRV